MWANEPATQVACASTSLLCALLFGAACGPTVADPGVQPADGPYSECAADDECENDLVCLLGTCTALCTFPRGEPDRASCPEVPEEVHAELGCVPRPDDVAWFAICALLCDADGVCPDGMECVTEEFQIEPEMGTITTSYCH